jgi:hypothetical protein
VTTPPPYGSQYPYGQQSGYGPPPGGYGAPQEPGYGYGQPQQPPPYGGGQPGYPTGLPGYPAGGPPQGPPGGNPIPTYLWQSIVVTLLCCLPAGIVAIINATRVSSRQQLGDIQGALDASRRAKTWCIVSLVVGLIASAVYIALFASGTMTFHPENSYNA